MSDRIPRIARWFLAAAAPATERQYLLDDLGEEFAEIARERGRGRAVLWSVKQVALSVGPLLVARLTIRRSRYPQPASARGDSMPAQLLDDLRYSVRVAIRRPWLSAVVIATMMLGIGATTAVFSLVDAVLLRPLAFPHAEQLVRLTSPIAQAPRIFSFNHEDFNDVARTTRTFSSLALFDVGSTTLELPDRPPQRIGWVLAGAGFAETLQLRPALGRLFEPNEDRAGGPLVVILSHELWTREFGADPSVIGRSITLASLPRTVVGVLPPARSEFPAGDVQLWIPLAIPERSYLRNRVSLQLGAIARLRPGATIEQSNVELTTLARRLAIDYPASNTNRTLIALPLRDTIVGPVRPMLLLLGGAVAAVLLIASANLGSLLLAHSHSRAREFAVRAAIGGATGRIARQLLTETLLLALIGGAGGIWLARALVQGLVAVYPERLPRAGEIGLDWRVLVAALGTTLLAGLLAAFPLTRQVRRLNLARDLRDGARGIGSRRRRRVLNALVVGQLAASVGLLFAAGVLLRTFSELTTIQPGFDPRNTLTANIALAMARYPVRARQAQVYDALFESLRAIPGVRSVGWSMFAPLDGRIWGDWFTREGMADVAPNLPSAQIKTISSDFAETLRIPVLEGRGFARTDRAGSPDVALVNAALAAQYYPGASAVGKRIAFDERKLEIVGVLADIRSRSLWSAPEPELYLPLSQWSWPTGVLYLRTDVAPTSIEGPLRAAIKALDPTIPLSNISTLEQRLGSSMAPERFRAILIGALAALAFILSILGIYGLVAQVVGHRTREIGIRMALGEAAGSVRRTVVADACRLGLTGVTLGVLLALGSAHWMQAFVGGNVGPRDPVALIGTALLLLAATVAAAWFPARRASRVDPLVAIRNE